MKHADKKNEMPLRDYSWIFFLVFSGAIASAAFVLGREEPALLIVFLVYSLFFLFPLFLSLRYPVLTETGVRRTFAGIGYRFVPWSEVRDVMRVYQQTGTRGNPLTLMVTTRQGNVYRPDEKGYIPPAQRRAFFREWIAGKSFMIDCSGKKSGPKIVAYVENTTARWTMTLWPSGKNNTPRRKSGGSRGKFIWTTTLVFPISTFLHRFRRSSARRYACALIRIYPSKGWMR